MKRAKPKVLRGVQPNAGIAAAYRKRINRLIDLMDRSVRRRIAAAYRGNPPRVAALAEDVSPAQALRGTIRWLRREWLRKFEDAAPQLADYFSTAVSDRSAATLQKILRDGGISVRFKMTPAQRDVVQASIAENVSLIKSIPSQYFTQIEGMVMRSVAAGRDLEQLSKRLRKQYGVTKRRAALISRDQNNKATAALTRTRQLELGVTKAMWKHSGAGKQPRPQHVKMDGKMYDVAQGMWDPVERAYVFPGELINCRCTSRTIVPGFS